MKEDKGHNPYFNRWFSAIIYKQQVSKKEDSHNPYFNRWFSAIKHIIINNCSYLVTILILIDGFLQYRTFSIKYLHMSRHNPYFNRWFSAMFIK